MTQPHPFVAILIASRKVLNPTLEQVQAVTPHIPDDVIAAKYDEIINGVAPVPEGVAAILSDLDDEQEAQAQQLWKDNGYRTLDASIPDDIRARVRAIGKAISDTKHRGWYFAVPGVHVDGAVYNFNLSWSADHGSKMTGDYCSNLRIGQKTVPDFGAEAHAWQREHIDPGTWPVDPQLIDPTAGHGLRQPRWGWFCANSVMDPSRRRPDHYAVKAGADPAPKPVAKGMQDGRPVHVAALAFVFKVGMGPNDRQTHSNGEAEEADCDLIIHSSQRLLWAEVKGANDRISGAPTTYCALCGDSIMPTGCGNCGYHYRDNQFDCGGGPAINKTAQALVEANGWSFEIDPQVARDARAAYLAKQQAEYDARVAGMARAKEYDAKRAAEVEASNPTLART